MRISTKQQVKAMEGIEFTYITGGGERVQAIIHKADLSIPGGLVCKALTKVCSGGTELWDDNLPFREDRDNVVFVSRKPEQNRLQKSYNYKKILVILNNINKRGVYTHSICRKIDPNYKWNFGLP